MENSTGPYKSDVLKSAKLLQVEDAADMETIKKTFRRLAIEWHPDKSKHKNAATKFKKFNEAFQMIQSYAREGGQFPISKFCKTQRTPRTLRRKTYYQAPEYDMYDFADFQDQQVVQFMDPETGSFFVMQSGPIDPSTFWTTLQKMFSPDLMNGMGNVIGGAQQIVGGWLGNGISYVGDNLKKAADVFGNQKGKNPIDKVDKLAGIVTGDQDGEGVRKYIKGFKNLSEGWKAVTTGLNSVSEPEAKKKKKKKDNEQTKKTDSRGVFVVAPRSLGRYKEMSNDGMKEFPLFGQLTDVSGNSTWGTYYVTLRSPDIAIIAGREYTLVCKAPE